MNKKQITQLNEYKRLIKRYRVPDSSSARDAIKIAGYLAGDSNGILNRYEQSISKATVTFKHYPALNRFNKKKVSNVHSLFGIPTYKERS